MSTFVTHCSFNEGSEIRFKLPDVNGSAYAAPHGNGLRVALTGGQSKLSEVLGEKHRINANNHPEWLITYVQFNNAMHAAYADTEE